MGNKNGKLTLKEEDVVTFCKTSGMDPKKVKIYSPVSHTIQSLKVRQYFEKFIAKHPDGTMNTGQFKEFIMKVKQ